MADELADLRKAIDSFPKDVTEALRSVAWRVSRRVKERATQILNARSGGKADRIQIITIVEDATKKQFLVISEGAADKPPNLALWWERGTRFFTARPSLRPAADAESDGYRNESVAAVTNVADRLGR